MYDIDLMWHAHMASSGAYARDTRALLGRVYRHDDALVGPSLEDYFRPTKALWEGSTGCTYNVSPSRRILHEVSHPMVGWGGVGGLGPGSGAGVRGRQGSRGVYTRGRHGWQAADVYLEHSQARHLAVPACPTRVRACHAVTAHWRQPLGR